MTRLWAGINLACVHRSRNRGVIGATLAAIGESNVR